MSVDFSKLREGLKWIDGELAKAQAGAAQQAAPQPPLPSSQEAAAIRNELNDVVGNILLPTMRALKMPVNDTPGSQSLTMKDLPKYAGEIMAALEAARGTLVE